VDEPNIRHLVAEFLGRPAPRIVPYGLSEGALWRALDVQANDEGGSDFTIYRGSQTKGRAHLLLPGRHNVKNALAALAVADLVGLDLDKASEALTTFQGVRRRFEVKGEKEGITVIDDYAHHPSQIRATLAAARQRYPARRIWALFQPHTFSRTKALFEGFTAAFGDADRVLVTDIYAAREHNDLGVRASDLAAQIKRGHVRYCATLDEAVEYLLQHIRAGDVLITLGAGDGFTVGERVLQNLAAT